MYLVLNTFSPLEAKGPQWGEGTCVFPPQPAEIYSAEFSCSFSVRAKAVSLLPAMSGQREHVLSARHNSCVLYSFWDNIITGKVHCNVRIVLLIEMSEDISNTDHSTWEFMLRVFFEHQLPSCPLLILFTAHTLSAIAGLATPPVTALEGVSLFSMNTLRERTIKCTWTLV